MKRAAFASIAFLVFMALGLAAVRLPASAADDTIVVNLPTEFQRLPIYAAAIDAKGGGFDSGYVAKLEKVLFFDLDRNGMTYALKTTPEREKLASSALLDQAPKAADWKSIGAYYVVKVRIQDKKLSARLYSVNGDLAKAIEGIALTGDLASDRRQVHQLADKIFKTLFNADGIASTRLLYTIKTKEGATWNSEVWESDYDGANKRQITKGSGYSVTPLYIPPKQGNSTGGIFFVSYKNGQPKIYYQLLNGEGEARRLTYLRGNQLMPAITRQRDKIAFISDATGNPDLFMQDFSPESGVVGKPYQAFATHRATQGTPAFSPDGERIAFVSNKDGSPRIYVMDVPEAGTSLNDIKASLITKRNRESTAPAWSPDGTKIAYCSITEGVRQIWVYDFTTNAERQLTQGAGNKENPTWAPNSLHLAFNSTDASGCEVYFVNLHQTEATRISSGDGEKRFPSWEPR